MDILDHASFTAKVLLSPSPALLCFHSPFSAYSRRTVAVLQDVSQVEFLHRIKFYYVDVDAVIDSTMWLQRVIVALPTIAVFCDGRMREFMVGERSRKAFVKMLESTCLPASPTVLSEFFHCPRCDHPFEPEWEEGFCCCPSCGLEIEEQNYEHR